MQNDAYTAPVDLEHLHNTIVLFCCEWLKKTLKLRYILKYYSLEKAGTSYKLAFASHCNKLAFASHCKRFWEKLRD